MQNKTAVLIFANSTQQEIENKEIRASFQLFEKLNSRVLRTVKRSGLPYFLITEKEQTGNSFGEKFTFALQQVFEQGFENVISIGNDTPQLSLSHLKRTARTLESNKMVLGPSRDGGFYLMGIHKSLFDKEQFLKLPWQTGRLARCVKRLIGKTSEKIQYLEVLKDIDTEDDLFSILHIFKGITAQLRSLILQIVEKASAEVFFKSPITIEIRFSLLFNKGSPSLLHF